MVKVNVPEVLRAELARPSWKGEHVALGTNTDPYQWVEGRYKLMRGIWGRCGTSPIRARSSRSRRCCCAARTCCRNRRADQRERVLEVPTLDEKAWRATEPHTPTPRARLEAVASSTGGIPTGS